MTRWGMPRNELRERRETRLHYTLPGRHGGLRSTVVVSGVLTVGEGTCPCVGPASGASFMTPERWVAKAPCN